MYDSAKNTSEIILSVSEFIESLNAALKEIQAKIIGEVISIKEINGHRYFTLKDKTSNAIINCIMWKYDYHINGVAIETGMEVILSGAPNLYAANGRLSFIAKTAELVGEGALHRAYLQLKEKLTKEGLFSTERKRVLPSFPKRIGIITSKQGAVIHDFENNLGKRGFHLVLIDTRVERKEAVFDLISSIKRMQNEELDILVIMRGGGSLQSLASFDNEAVVRAIANFPVPVIAAIGHHQDIPLAALVADSSPSTPTAAAHIVSDSWDQADRNLIAFKQTILSDYQEQLHGITINLQLRKESITENFNDLIHIFTRASNRIIKGITRMNETMQFHITTMQETQDRLINTYSKTIRTVHHMSDLIWRERIQRSFVIAIHAEQPLISDNPSIKIFANTITEQQTSLVHCEQIITLNNPLRLLKHGYSILKNGDRLVKHIEDVKIGDTVDILVLDGTIHSTVSGTKQTTNN